MTPAQKHLVEKNIALARYLAKSVWSRNREQMELDEVTAVAYQGLMAAAIKFDPHAHGMSEETIENGKAFSGFARVKINGYILDWQRSLDHVQRSFRADYRRLTRAGFTGQLEQGVTADMLAERTGLTSDRVRIVIRAVLMVPISTDSVQVESVDTPVSHHDVESTAVETSIKVSVHEALLSLPPLHQVVVAMRYYEHKELQAIAQELDVGLTLIREAHSEAVLIIHQAMRARVDTVGGLDGPQRRSDH